ncbi:MAG: hypothetical protein NDI61_00565 [Bdellovibrionaceae bacterium]|nr:hypothetical protein [Pseudobdellovibrionaceae bacterium]
MVGRALKILIAVVLCLSVATPALAQTPPPQETSRDKATNAGPRRQLATIIFAGLGGAVLGLSTLSFYGRPQDKLSNIAIGFAVGVITGTIYSTYSAATNPQEFYGDRPWMDLETDPALAQHEAVPSPVALQLSWTF